MFLTIKWFLCDREMVLLLQCGQVCEVCFYYAMPESAGRIHVSCHGALQETRNTSFKVFEADWSEIEEQDLEKAVARRSNTGVVPGSSLLLGF